MSHFLIREIQTKDNQQVAAVIRTVLTEFGAPKVGTAYEDKALDDMCETYNTDTSAYFVVVDKDRVIGGGGVSSLAGEVGVCEIQKMYFLEEARGKGLGKKMMETCMQKAKELGFKRCYIETLPYMTSAMRLYEKLGFEYIEGPMGTTGHYSCDVWMIKEL
ncbi:GNAT family N-acetyltransferase [Formosa sediminum]|uniref:GNAT family N-acetyltransferase n=1 Tax=Formosa sediminum TaxID=2594004 RepID=A0A516GVR3_9FLAO|nr:GNAT family N-acetyltransferase [Formosa sediminum]QDO95611.1 GNAT family N-acetyltransferase [Formosa sediminum]